MEKWFCYGSMGAAGLVFLLFLLDIIPGVNIPFGGTSMIIDILGLISAAVVFFLGFDAYRDLR